MILSFGGIKFLEYFCKKLFTVMTSGKTKRLILLFLIFLSCERPDNQTVCDRLQKWDTQLTINPERIRDSLKMIDREVLSGADRAYFDLMKVIADDKSFVAFTSDSLITSVEDYYRRHEPNSYNHIRSLIYQGIVRYRMGVKDSTVMHPFQEAKKIYSHRREQDPILGYFIHYYLGEVLIDNQQSPMAKKYLNKALSFAKSSGNKNYEFDAYVELYWCEMIQDHYSEAKSYLDTLQTFTNLSSDDRYTLYNAQSIYYDTQHDYQKALDFKKKQKDLIPYLNHEKEFFRLYYSISERYGDINRPDSAFYYAKLAIDNIQDTSNIFNYLLYENIADAAEKLHDYKTANDYRKTGMGLLEKNIERKTEMQVVALEKKYSLGEAENKALKMKEHNRYLISALVILSLFIVLLYFYISKQKSLGKLKQKQLEAEMQQTMLQHQIAETKALYAVKQSQSQQQMLLIYSTFVKHFADQVHKTTSLAINIRGKNPQIADKLDLQLTENRKNINLLTTHLFSPEKLAELLKLNTIPTFLNHHECLILFMMAEKMGNAQIAALLNTTNDSFKTRKSQLKKKISLKAQDSSDLNTLLNLFNG